MSLENWQRTPAHPSEIIEMDQSLEETLVASLMMPSDNQGFFRSHQRIPVDQVVRLRKDIPTLLLRRGELGVVVGVWCAPITVYEVDFCRPDDEFHSRVLVLPQDLQQEPAGDARD